MEEDNIRRGAIGALLVIISLVALGAVPPHSVGGVTLRRINILSQLWEPPVEQITLEEEVMLELDEEEYTIDLDAVAREVQEARNMMVMATNQNGGAVAQSEVDVEVEVEELSNDDMVDMEAERLLAHDVELTPIEDFDTLPNGKLNSLYRKLAKRGTTTRIAVLGDSFIEGDILTADLREAMQIRYGGCGAGFAPMDSPLTKYRRTIKTESQGWESYNIMQRKKAPEKYSSSWAVSGWICEATSNGASVRWECTDNRERLDSCSRVRLLFVCRESCEISVALNSGTARKFVFEGSQKLQQIELCEEWISCCEMRVESGAEGFVGYGAFFEGDGVVVDNYSIRSNNGQAMLWSNPAINAQIDGLVGGYDMVVLQYGLNILQRGVKNYTSYGEQIEKMIAFARLCFPKAAVVVMGVSDRSMRENGHYEPLIEAIDMTSYQREAARRSGAAFWDTHAAMSRRGGMAEFVANGWAGKDFTHINFAGGREIGRALAEAINVARNDAYPREIEKLEIEPIGVEDKYLEGLTREHTERDWALERTMMECVEQGKKERARRSIW